jgi:hypothetical protein
LSATRRSSAVSTIERGVVRREHRAHRPATEPLLDAIATDLARHGPAEEREANGLPRHVVLEALQAGARRRRLVFAMA